MGNGGAFGFDPEDIDRVIREAGEGLRDVLGRAGQFFAAPGERAGWGALFEEFVHGRRPEPAPTTAGDAGDGVWAIYVVDDDGDARVEQVYATEIEALRANRHNTDPRRKVRFLPYGIGVSVLDDPQNDSGETTGTT